MINRIEPPLRSRAISFLARFPEFWDRLENTCRQALQATVENVEGEESIDYRVIIGVRLPQFRRHLLRVIERLTADQLQEALNLEVVMELWGKALKVYQESRSYRSSEANFRDFVRPFSGKLGAGELDELLVAIECNGQNWNAAETPELLASFVESNSKSRPTRDGLERFLTFLTDKDLEERYEEVIGLFDEVGSTIT